MRDAVDRIIPVVKVPPETERVMSLDPIVSDEIWVRLAITLLRPHKARQKPERLTVGAKPRSGDCDVKNHREVAGVASYESAPRPHRKVARYAVAGLVTVIICQPYGRLACRRFLPRFRLIPHRVDSVVFVGVLSGECGPLLLNGPL